MGSYKIKDVEILTGIKAHTIRIWEKRYNLLNPERTDTQIRQYSDDDLVRLLQVSLLNKRGLKISKIIELQPDQISEQLRKTDNKNDLTEVIIEQFILSLFQLDEELFNASFLEISASYTIQECFANFLFPFLERIGVMWIVGSINPAQEHFISNIIRQKVIAAIDAIPVPHSKDVTILFLPEYEWHEIGLLVYHYELRKKGVKTIYLGQSLPYDAIFDAIDYVKPTRVISAWITNAKCSEIKNYFQSIVEKYPEIEFILGGAQTEKISFASENLKIVRNLEEFNALIS